MVRYFMKKIFFEKGSGDIVGFLAMLPVTIFMLVILISMVQLGSIKERLEYTAYLACRKAVVAYDTDQDGKYIDDAKKIALQTARDDLAKSKLKYVPGSVKVDLKLVSADANSSNSSTAKWEKGNYIQCTVSVKVKSVTPFLSGRKSATIVMMIEKPATEGSSYPWFDNIS